MFNSSKPVNLFFFNKLVILSLTFFTANSISAQITADISEVNGHKQHGLTEKKDQSSGLVYYNENFSKIVPERTYPAEIGKKYNSGEESHPDFGKLPFNAPQKNVVEVLSKRKIDERYYVDIDQPSFFYIQKSGVPLHFEKNGKLIAIDPTLKKQSEGVYVAKNQPYPTAVDFNAHKTIINCNQYNIESNNYSLSVIDNSNNIKTYSANWSNYMVGNNGGYVIDIFPGVDMKLVFGEGQLKSNFIVKAPIANAKRLILTDNVNVPSGLNLVQAYGAPGTLFSEEININDISGKSQFKIRRAISTDASGDRTHISFNNYRLVGNSIELHVDSSFLNMSGIVYPLTIDPLITAVGPISAPANSMGSQLTPAFCTQTLTISFPGGSTPYDFTTSWATEQQFCCSSLISCFNSDARVEILSNCGGRTPSGAGLYWSCTPGCATSGTWSPTIPFNGSGCQSMVQCLPPSCSPQNVTFSLNLLRVFCSNGSGCGCTYATNSCSRLQSWNVTLQGRTVEWTNVVTPFTLSSNTVCAGGNITATSNGTSYGVNPHTLTWSFNSSGTPTVASGSPASINFPSAGNYTVYGVVTDACGATNIVSQTATAIAIPTANAGTTKSLTCSQTTTVINGTGGGTYSWTGPGTITSPTSQNPTVNTPGTFSLTVNVAGCTSPAATVSVVQNTTAPVTSAGTSGSVTCTNLAINLTNTLTGATYTWVAPGGSSITGGVNNQNTTGSGAGTYTVRVTDAVNGCTNIATVAALVNTVAPVTSAGTSGSITCTNNSINLTSTLAGANYTWTAPGGSSITGGANSQNTTGSGAGTYTVKVQDAVNGCTTTATVAALINTVNPIPTAGTSASVTCTNSVINLTSTPASGVSYTWTAPAGSSITGGVNSQNTTGSGPGTYTVRVQDAVNGCTAIATVAANINTTAPTPTAGIAGLVTCGSTTVSLTSGPAAMNYTWTAPAGSSITGGVNTQNTSGSGPGTYSVLVQNPTNGCSTQTVVTASTNTTLPSPSITAPSTITCSNPTITLNGNPGAGVTYTWSGPGVVGSANNQTVNVNQVGTYSLFVTSTVNSCTNVITASVGNNTIAPTTTPVGTQTITCATPSVQLIGSANPSSCTVVWTGGVCAGATSYTASACAAGNYTYIATNPANGCQSAAQVATVVPNAGVPTATLVNTGTITCLTTSVQVVGTTTTSPATYTWSGPGIVGVANTPTINVNQGGVYTLTLTNTLNGCTSVITNSITADNAAVTPTTTSSTIITCTNPTSTITTNVGAGAYTYNWSGPGIVGTNTLSTATSSLGGTYNVTVTNTSNGCVGIGTISVASSTTVPASVTVTPSSFTLSCATPTTQILVGSTGGTTYSWTAPATGSIVSGASSTTATIQGPGVYSVVATATNGCSAPVTTATMVADVNSPAVTLSSPNLSITCTSAAPGLTLTPTGTVAIASYSWSPASGISSGSNTTTPTFTASGTYVCLITASNGCTITTSVPVTNNTVAPTAITPTIANISCASSSVDINPAYTPSTGLTYTWTGTGISGSANNSSVTVNQSGTYTVSMLDPVNGCTNTATFAVNGNTIAPTVTVTSTSSIGIGCLPTNTAVTLDATTTPSTGITYAWSTTATTQTISVTTSGVYTVVITDAVNGCSVSTQYTVSNGSTLPNISAGANANIPCGGVTTTVTLNGSSTDPGVTYSWNGPGIVSGSNTATPIVNMAGTYTLTVTNPTTGCSSTSTVDVINAVPTASISSDVSTGFAPLTVNFSNSSSNANTFSWNFGNGSTSVLTTTASTSATYGWGTYTITMIASSGLCSDTASVVIVVNDGFTIEVPNVFTPNDDKVNDVFTITSTGVKEITLKIFNRWGQLMYDFSGPKAAWDGVTTSGEKASNGTYFYFIKATGFDGKEYEKNGPVSLFR